jgi:HK97 family phage major capsid protein
MKLTKDELIELLKGQVSDVMGGDDFSNLVKETIQDMVKDLQNDVQTPFQPHSGTQLVQRMPFVSMDGHMMTTKQGSIINLRNRQNPWLMVSDEVKQWATDFSKYLKTGQTSKLLSSAVDDDGGYLVPEEFRALMIMYDMEDTLVWSRATVWPMAGEKLAFPKLMQNPDVQSDDFDHFAGVSFEWTEEGGEKQETQPEFGLVEMIVHELAGYTELTNTLLDDSVINLMNYLTRIFRSAWYWYTDKEFLNGSGGKKPLGILNDPNILTVNRQTASTVVVDDILNMDARLPAMFDAAAVWFITKTGRAALRGQKVSSTSDELVLQESYANLKDGYDMTILGKPAMLADGKVPALGTAGDVVLGAWQWYYIGFRQDFSMDSSRHYRFRHNRTSLRCSGRLDGQAAVPQAFVMLDDVS